MKKYVAICVAVLGLSYHAMASEKSELDVTGKAAASEVTTAERVEQRKAADLQGFTVEDLRQAGVINHPAGDGRSTFAMQKEVMLLHSSWGEADNRRYDERFGAGFF